VNKSTACDTDAAFETFATDLMEYVGLRVEDLGDRRYLFKPEYGQMDSLPGLDPKGMMATFDRTDALNRDDIQFFTPDHPLLRNSLDSLLSSEKGNAVLSVYQGTDAPGIFLQVTYLVECVAPRDLHIDRYLAISPDHSLARSHRRDHIRSRSLRRTSQSLTGHR
jgi:ATP-dependent helicase HepA